MIEFSRAANQIISIIIRKMFPKAINYRNYRGMRSRKEQRSREKNDNAGGEEGGGGGGTTVIQRHRVLNFCSAYERNGGGSLRRTRSRLESAGRG